MTSKTSWRMSFRRAESQTVFRGTEDDAEPGIVGAPGLAMGASGLLGVPDRGPGVLMGAPGPAPGPAPGYYARAEHVFWVPLAAHSVGRKERAKRDEWLDAGRRGKSPRTLDRAGKARARVSALEGLWMALKKRRRCSCHCLVEREMKRARVVKARPERERESFFRKQLRRAALAACCASAATSF